MHIGRYKLTALETGRFYLDGGAMFGVIPKVLWNKSNPADERNRIELALRTLLIRDDKHCIMVDTGIGENWDEKLSDIYGIDHSKFMLKNSLASIGMSTKDITDVIITHLHFDHAGGATYVDKDGSIRPTFPNATYYIQRKHYEWAVKPSLKDQASFVGEKYIPLYEQGKLKLLEGEVELYPGIFIKLSDGHTIAQQTILITDGKRTLYHPGDMIPTSSHVPLPFIMGYDNFPLITLEEKKSILSRAVSGDWILFFEHDPKYPATSVEKTEKGYRAGKPVGMNAE
ncbi:MAG: MBL fold metallo-hydrolase [Bacteroidetes bacterium]|nr:MBL fold metallo-hydrolase [Bacteroidota bacterium]MCL5738883.1 MBL fold metallo-hydrolase [Bacteroidota bacterium]